MVLDMLLAMVSFLFGAVVPIPTLPPLTTNVETPTVKPPPGIAAVPLNSEFPSTENLSRTSNSAANDTPRARLKPENIKHAVIFCIALFIIRE